MVYFEIKNTNLGKFWRVKAMEDVGLFYGHLVYFSTIWYMCRSFGIFFPFGMLYAEKSGNPAQTLMKN
jgi:hypothetical protein